MDNKKKLLLDIAGMILMFFFLFFCRRSFRLRKDGVHRQEHLPTTTHNNYNWTSCNNNNRSLQPHHNHYTTSQTNTTHYYHYRTSTMQLHWYWCKLFFFFFRNLRVLNGVFLQIYVYIESIFVTYVCDIFLKCYTTTCFSQLCNQLIQITYPSNLLFFLISISKNSCVIKDNLDLY